MDKENGNIDSDDSGVETEKEWLDDSQLVEFAQRFPTNALEALAFEVCPLFFFGLETYDYFIEAIVAGLF